MTEAQWLACVEPIPMLKMLRGKGSNRRFLLFGAAIFSHSLASFSYESFGPIFFELEAAVLSIEGYADARVQAEELSTLKDRICWTR